MDPTQAAVAPTGDLPEIRALRSVRLGDHHGLAEQELPALVALGRRDAVVFVAAAAPDLGKPYRLELDAALQLGLEAVGPIRYHEQQPSVPFHAALISRNASYTRSPASSRMICGWSSVRR